MVAQIDSLYVKTRPLKLWSRLISYAFYEGRPLTTRGQWINPMLFARFALEKKIPELKKIKTPVFILGTGRSGTTILGIVLSIHKDVGFLNEPKALWHAVYPDEDLIGSYSRGRAKYRLTSEDANDEVIKIARRIYSAYLTVTGSSRVVDKYPELIFRVEFIKRIFPDAKFLFLVRNGWDTCHSIEGWSERLGHESGAEVHDWWGVNRRKWNLLLDQVVPEHSDLAPHVEEMRCWTNQTDMAAVEWIVTMREGLSLVEAYPQDVMQVSYEELCERPREILRQIADFACLQKDNVFEEYGANVLTKSKAKLPLELNPRIMTPFANTSKQLGYHLE